MVTINGLDKASSANRDVIKTHLVAHPEDALDLPTELIASILRAHMSNLNTDRVSEQSSAFAAQMHPEPATNTASSTWTFLYKMFVKVTVNLSGCKPPSIKKNTI